MVQTQSSPKPPSGTSATQFVRYWTSKGRRKKKLLTGPKTGGGVNPQSAIKLVFFQKREKDAEGSERKNMYFNEKLVKIWTYFMFQTILNLLICISENDKKKNQKFFKSSQKSVFAVRGGGGLERHRLVRKFQVFLRLPLNLGKERWQDLKSVNGANFIYYSVSIIGNVVFHALLKRRIFQKQKYPKTYKQTNIFFNNFIQLFF